MPYTETHNTLPPSLFTELKTRFDAALDNIFTAGALAVYHRGALAFEGYWGYIDPDTKRLPVSSQSLFDLASVSKMFNSTAFLSLVSAGKVSIDDPIVRVIPEFGASGARGTDGGQDPFTKAMLPTLDDMRGKTVDPNLVTFRHLLTHTSGLAPWRALYLLSLTPPPSPEPDPVSLETRWQTVLDAICRSPFVDLPGRTIRYSDLGFMLVGMSVARLHGTPLETALQERLLYPLGLHSVVYNPLQKGVAREHIVPTEFDATWRGRRLWGEVDDENTGGMGGASGHAGLFARLEDVLGLGKAWLERDARLGIDAALMDKATRKQAQTGDVSHGYGWKLGFTRHPNVTPVDDTGVFGHSGFTGASLRIDPRRELVVACLTNRIYMGREKVGNDEFQAAVQALCAAELA